ncbi:MAG: hypothetical protein OEW59_06685, partial [Gammaproteobacteria bacterium]|nr:hypothetical protein [Gammaproteobacteria bacterium]
GLELGFLLPDVHYHVAGRWRGQFAASSGSVWRKAVVLSADFGEPQYKNDITIFVASKQVSLGLEWERRISTKNNWLNAYGSLGAGWRREMATVEDSPSNQTSDTVDRAVLAIGTGLRFYASSLGDHSHYRIQTGLTLWLPTSDAALTVGSTNLTLQKPAAALSISVLFEFG